LTRWLARLELSVALDRSGIDPPAVTIERLERAAADATRHGDAATEALILGNLLEELDDLGDFGRAETVGRRALALIGGRNPTHRAWILASLGANAARGGKPGGGREDLLEGLRLIQQHPALHVIDAVLASTTAVLATNGHYELAARAIGLNHALGERLGSFRVPSDIAILERDRRSVTHRLGEVRMRLMEDRGRAADPLLLLEEIIQVLEAPSQAPETAEAARPRVRHGELTRREVEVLGLLAQGKSDAEIGTELFITPSTASVHVSNVKGKLGVKTRLEAAMKARELGL
jgi:DNA-binding CsgD family transcriptional regulator